MHINIEDGMAFIYRVWFLVFGFAFLSQTIDANEVKNKTVASSDNTFISQLPLEHPFSLCASCHGDQGEGIKELAAPRLMGQHFEYLKNQVKAFKTGWRGREPDNVPGLMMANAIASLSEKEINAALEYVVEVKASVPSHRIFGDRWRGEHLYQRGCAICHGEEGEGSTQYHMAKLNMQHGWYLKKQLENYRSGNRGVHKDDESGKTMAFYAKLLPDEESVTDVVSWLTYISRLKYREEQELK